MKPRNFLASSSKQVFFRYGCCSFYQRIDSLSQKLCSLTFDFWLPGYSMTKHLRVSQYSGTSRKSTQNIKPRWSLTSYESFDHIWLKVCFISILQIHAEVILRRKSVISHWEISISCTIQECNNVTTPSYPILALWLSSVCLWSFKFFGVQIINIRTRQQCCLKLHF